MGLFLSKERPIGEMNTPFFFFDNRNSLQDWFVRILSTISDDQFVFVATNAQRPICLANKSNLTFISLKDLEYSSEYNQFLEVYQHLSTHEPSFELACFERYFALKSCMKLFALESIWHLDTDVVPTSQLRTFSEFELVFSSPYSDLSVASAHTGKFSRNGIDSFTKYLVGIFYQQNFPFLEKTYKERVCKGLLGGITDMTAIAFWLRTLDHDTWFNSYKNPYNGVGINHIFSHLSAELNPKSVETRFIFIRFSRTGWRIYTRNNMYSFATLHFQGHFKALLIPLIKYKFLLGSSRIFLLITKIRIKLNLLLMIK